MRINWKTMTALAGTLVLSAAVANAAPVLNLKPSANTGSNFVDLARDGGGAAEVGGGGGGGGNAAAAAVVMLAAAAVAAEAAARP